MLKAMGGGTLEQWEKHLAEATWLANTGGSIHRESCSGNAGTTRYRTAKTKEIKGKFKPEESIPTHDSITTLFIGDITEQQLRHITSE